ncbi:DUF6300 family protein [Streptomyces sp. MCC20]|uniref:DUF6300 family protein n=1 Tax=Streptomyces sediminimaris TaxID=3383721 RepID=UPI00399A8593
MTFAWRYYVRPDGSFCRLMNIDGSLDSMSDEDLARLPHVGTPEKTEPTPCSRCAQDLLLYWNGPAMTGVWLELCPICDASRPAATALIAWIRDSDRRPADLPQLFDDWESETMQALGWSFVPAAGAPADLPSYEGHAPRGHG